MRCLFSRSFIQMADGSITVGTLSEIPTGSREDRFRYLNEATDVTGIVLDGHPLCVRPFGMKDHLGLEQKDQMVLLGSPASISVGEQTGLADQQDYDGTGEARN